MGNLTLDLEKEDNPRIGDFVRPDDWAWGNPLSESDGYKDSSFPGCAFRLSSEHYDLAVNVTRSGRKKTWSKAYGVHPGTWKYRVKIEFVGDGEPSTYTNGWLYQYAH
jgi:hypothetical protein